MKTLIVGIGSQEDIKNAFAEHGDVIYWDWTKVRNFQFNQSLVALVEKHRPDLVFMQIQTPGIISIAAAKNISARSKVINWTGDVRYPLPEWFIEIGKHIDLTLFSNMTDVETARNRGINVDYLQIGFPNNIFKKTGSVKNNVPDIIFMGNNNGGFPLSKLRSDMVKRLKERYGDGFGCYGVNWGNGIFPVNDQYEEASYYKGAKIGINLSHFNYKRYTSDRMFRIIGAGCFCLSQEYPDMELEFEKGKHLDSWTNLSELFEKIDYYLDNEELRNKIAQQGYMHCHQNHTWSNRINELFYKINNGL